MVEPWWELVGRRKGDAVGREDKPGKHDGTRDGQGVYQPEKTQTPKDYGRGKHEKDDPPQDDPTKGN